MSNSFFQFKQFRLEQSLAGMKFGMDSATLGAWANHPSPASILDIGTGTGVLALMLAQRYDCPIDAVEIEENAFVQTNLNFTNSPWADRLFAHHQDINSFDQGKKYDLIVSNPPYFHRSYSSPDQKRQLARHSESLSTQDLLQKVADLLNKDGFFFVVIPSASVNEYEKEGEMRGLLLQEKVDIITVEGKMPARCILKFGKRETQTLRSSVTVKDKDGNYTEVYSQLLKDYFLIF